MAAQHKILFALIALALGVAVAVVLIGGGGDSSDSTTPDPKAALDERARPPGPERSADVDPHLAAELGAIARAGASEDHHHAKADPRREAAIRAAGEAFLRFYLAYEVGRGGPPVLAGIRRTATAELGRELLAAPPRFPPGLEERPALASVTEIAVVDEWVPPEGSTFGTPQPPRPSFSDAGIVVRLERDGKPEAASFGLSLEGERWLVSGVSG